VLDTLKGVGKYDTAIAEADLEDWTVLFGQACGDFGMMLTEL